MDEFAPVCKFTYMQNKLHMCKFGHENGAQDISKLFLKKHWKISLQNIFWLAVLEMKIFNLLVRIKFLNLFSYSSK